MGTPAVPDPRLLTLQVRLVGARPPVWRRIEVLSDTTVEVFGEVLLAAMGWRNLHRHEIVVLDHGDRHGDSGTHAGDPGPVDEWATPVADLLGEVGDRIGYRYDLVADRRHEVETVATGPAPDGHPGAVLLDGRGACPADAEPGESAPSERSRFRVKERDAAVRAAVHLPHGRREIALREAEVVAWFVHRVGDGVRLTDTDRLPDEVVAEILARFDWARPGHTPAGHRTGRAPEELAYPVLVLDARARAMGLVEAGDGVLTATADGRDLAGDAERLAERIADTYPRSVLWGSAPRGWSARG